MKHGLLLIVSGPSGSGKGSVVKLVREKRDFMISVSATTRSPRPGEEDGKDYFFISKEEFEKKIDAGEMLEYTFYSGSGQYYGTPKSAVVEALENGRDVILEIEVDGAMQVKKQLPEAILLFVTAPSVETLRARLEGRGTETPESLEKRMLRAENELAIANHYDYLIINEEGALEQAADQILDIARAEDLRMGRNTKKIETLQKDIRR